MNAPNQDNTAGDDDLKEFFPLDYRGDPMAEGHFREDHHGWVQGFYECRACKALVMDPRGHAHWHKEVA